MATSSASVDTTALHTVAVFADLASATRGVEALLTRHTFPSSVLSVLAKDEPSVLTWMTTVLGSAPSSAVAPDAGAVRCAGPLAADGWAAALDGGGIEELLRVAGFQGHDGRIFARLVERGGILVAVTSEARAADALAVMHDYGGGNAGIGAWRGRV